MTPKDDMVFFDEPGLFRPEADEVHISTVFTWDISRSQYLKECWSQYYPMVKVGGPAYGDPGGEFEPGKYIKPGVTITSRGCPNKCGFCLVPEREGNIRELEIYPGNIIQDNNILACSKEHLKKVFAMLKEQRDIIFLGGLEASRVTDWIAEELDKLRIDELWFACDNDNSIEPLRKATEKLKRKNSHKLRCYVLCGYGDQTIPQAENRLRQVYELGFMPFGQLYQPAHQFIEYPQEWKEFIRKWSRPAIIRVRMEKTGGYVDE